MHCTDITLTNVCSLETQLCWFDDCFFVFFCFFRVFTKITFINTVVANAINLYMTLHVASTSSLCLALSAKDLSHPSTGTLLSVSKCGNTSFSMASSSGGYLLRRFCCGTESEWSCQDAFCFCNTHRYSSVAWWAPDAAGQTKAVSLQLDEPLQQI